MRRKPPKLNFNSTPANTTLPHVGLSTCTLGNQVCRPNKGTFTRNINISPHFTSTLTIIFKKALEGQHSNIKIQTRNTRENINKYTNK